MPREKKLKEFKGITFLNISVVADQGLQKVICCKFTFLAFRRAYVHQETYKYFYLK